MIRRRRRHFHEHVESDLEILPLMNLFVVLIPMLLLSAVFIELAVIRMNLPTDDAPTETVEKDRAGLSIAIEDGRWIVRGKHLEARTVDREGDDPEGALRAALADVAALSPDTHDLVIESRPTTRYDDIVTVMDASRDAGLGDISLAAAGS